MQRVLCKAHRKKTKPQTDNLLKGLAYCYSRFNQNSPQFASDLDTLARLLNLLNRKPLQPYAAYYSLVDTIILQYNSKKQGGLPQLIPSDSFKAAFAMMLAHFSNFAPNSVLSAEVLSSFDATFEKWLEQKTSNYLLQEIVTPQHTHSSLFTGKVNFSEIELIETKAFKQQTLQAEIFCWALATFFEKALNGNRLQHYRKERALALRELRTHQTLFFSRLPREVMTIVAETLSAEEHRMGHVV